MSLAVETVKPDSKADPAKFFYPQALDKTLHSVVKKLLHMDNADFARKYCQRHEGVNEATLLKIMDAEAKFYRWGGADLMRARDAAGREKMVIIEMNSCPSGNKSVPYLDWGFEGFRRVMANAFLPLLSQTCVEGGGLAVFYDVSKQRKESLAYATILAQLTSEEVFLADVGYGVDMPAFLRWTAQGVCQLEVQPGEWRPMRAVFRYVTRRPWVKLPLMTKTVVLNPVVACLAGGRNKLVASKAYGLFNEKYEQSDGLCINTPLTINDVTIQAIPAYAQKMNYQLVVKVPYGNCGIGVYTITSPRELQEFMDTPHVYDKFVVQGLISHPQWPRGDSDGQLHHVGCRPMADPENLYVNDLRFMICASPKGWMPVALYSRRSAVPLRPECSYPSWDMLGTNLSMGADGTSGTDTSRLLLLDTATYPELNLGLDELVESYVQTVLAATAVENLCQRLMHWSGDSAQTDPAKKISFDLNLFMQLDEDHALLREIARGCAQSARLFRELGAAIEDHCHDATDGAEVRQSSKTLPSATTASPSSNVERAPSLQPLDGTDSTKQTPSSAVHTTMAPCCADEPPSKNFTMNGAGDGRKVHRKWEQHEKTSNEVTGCGAHVYEM